MAQANVGTLNVNIKVDMKQFQKSIKSVSKQMKSLSQDTSKNMKAMQKSVNSATTSIKTQAQKMSTSVNKSVEKMESRLTGFSSKMTQLGKQGMAVLTLPLGLLGAKAFSSASDFEESLNKVSVTFGDNAKVVEDWSKSAIKNMGMAQGTALEMVALYGDMGSGMGLTSEQALQMSMSLTQLAGDLASYKNVSQDIAKTALAGIFTGETESLKSLGYVMTQTNLDEFARQKGLKATTKEMNQQQQVLLRYMYIMDKTANAQGDFLRTSDGASNQMRIFSESLKELCVQFGQVLLPVLTPVIQKANEFLSKLMDMDDGTRKMIVSLAGLLMVLPPLLIIFAQIGTGISNLVGLGTKLAGSFTNVVKVFGLTGSTAGIVIGSIALLSLGLIYAYNSSETFRASVQNLGQTFSVLIQQLSPIFELLGTAFAGVCEGIISYIDVLISKFSNFIQFFINIFTGNWQQAWMNIQNIAIASVNSIINIVQTLVNSVIGVANTFDKLFGGDGNLVKKVNWLFDYKETNAPKPKSSNIFKSPKLNSAGTTTGNLGVSTSGIGNDITNALNNMSAGLDISDLTDALNSDVSSDKTVKTINNTNQTTINQNFAQYISKVQGVANYKEVTGSFIERMIAEGTLPQA